VIGFGEPYKVAHELNPAAKMVFLMTENLPSYVRQKFQERCDYYYERHGKHKTGIVRDAGLFKDEYLKYADYLMRISNHKLNPANHKEFLFAPTGLINTIYNWNTKDYEKCKYNFVWFGSPGAIHKGLDILIDVFSKLPQCKLFIYGLARQEEFLLKNAPSNIIKEEPISVFSKEYIENVVERCSFVIMPSCSECISTGVITNMLHGLIPVVSKECQIPEEPFTITLRDFRCEYIENQIKRLLEMSNEELEKMSKDNFEFSRSRYTLASYRERLHNIFDEIIENSR